MYVLLWRIVYALIQVLRFGLLMHHRISAYTSRQSSLNMILDVEYDISKTYQQRTRDYLRFYIISQTKEYFKRWDVVSTRLHRDCPINALSVEFLYRHTRYDWAHHQHRNRGYYESYVGHSSNINY